MKCIAQVRIVLYDWWICMLSDYCVCMKCNEFCAVVHYSWVTDRRMQTGAETWGVNSWSRRSTWRTGSLSSLAGTVPRLKIWSRPWAEWGHPWGCVSIPPRCKIKACCPCCLNCTCWIRVLSFCPLLDVNFKTTATIPTSLLWSSMSPLKPS